MSGILSPSNAFELIKSLKENINLPIHLHTHSTTGMSTLTNMRAIEAGVDNIDTSISSMSMTYGHSATETMVFVLSETDFETKIDLTSLTQIAVDFKVLREKNKEHEGSLKGIDFQMLLNQVPGGMLSNLESQLKDLKKESLLESVINEIYSVRKDMGFVPLVTPTSQIIGAQALSNVISEERYKNLSMEIIDLALGYYGKLPGEINKKIIEKASQSKEGITSRPADLIPDSLNNLRKDLKKYCAKLKIKDFSEDDEKVIIFALNPYGAENLLKNLK